MTDLTTSEAELFTRLLVRAVTARSDKEFAEATMSVAFISGLISEEEQVRATEAAIREVQQIPVEKRGRAIADLEIVLAGRKKSLARMIR